MAKTSPLREFWNHQRRLLIYKRLVEQFGPFGHWGGARYPAGQQDAFNQCLQRIALELEAESGRDVVWTKLRNQVQWAIGSQRFRSEVVNDGYWNNLVRNKRAALEAGLITPSDMPSDDQTKEVG
jgi:hypothetical protein